MALPPLPDDIIYEVFTRTSLETLRRIRQLSKEWNQVTYDSTFMQQFRQRTKTISGFFFQNVIHGKHRSSFVSIDYDDQNPEAYKVSLSFLPLGAFPVIILASAPQGILLCEKDTQKRNVRRYYVCKPTTKQWQAIPNPKTRYLTKAIACGKFNWLLSYHNHIFTFDLNTESWEIFALPWEVIRDECDDDEPYDKYEKLGQVLEIVGCEGRLGLVCMGRDEECISLWVMEEYGHKKVWRKRKKIGIEELKRKEHQASLLAFWNTDVVLTKGYYELIFYKFENYCSTCTTFSKVVTWEESTANQVFALESDFEPVYLGLSNLSQTLNQYPLLISLLFLLLCIVV
ncbi:hypothetical protein FNV43_RR17935 [Rhamnella rubrinervis]|uniref:F-box domain-containing protein n=1 Tax=Rhamnella rubrinervis TaxID=2594499 RepID=A0A8K0EAC8_9ROSA|nr:hypothetical protein FNV43_RR17935 [Rhamnella rubrinervis]